ncbi:MAG: hypothetical protein N3A60_08970 [Thermanaerothrix sp.]|nr:hypothetical protein [Thermanaerothrix sp.]
MMVLFLQKNLPPNLLAAHGWLYLRQAIQPEFFLPWSVFYLVMVSPSLLLIGGIVLIWGVLLLNLVQVYFFTIAQCISAWTQDGLVPPSWGYQRRGQQVPAAGLFGAGILALLGMAIGLSGNWVHLVLYCPYAFALSSIGPLIGLIRYIWIVRKESKVPLGERGDKRFVGLFILGIAALGIMIAVISGAWGFPQELRVSREFALGLLILWFVGLGWYWGRVNFWRRQGVNLREKLHDISSHAGG